MAEKMAGVREGRDNVEGPDGLIIHVYKSPDDSKYAGFVYAIETLGARLARGDVIEEWELNALAARAEDLGIHNPARYVSEMIYVYDGSTQARDARKK